MPAHVDPSAPGPYVLALESRVSRLEDDVRDIRGSLARLEAGVARIEATLVATLPHLATSAELAEKPGKAYMWAVLGVLVTAILGSFAAGLAALATLR
jgi:hypothetical protein